MMGWICEEERWIGLVISGWYVGDIIQISPTHHPDITHISSKYHPHIIQISPTYHPDIIHISPTYRPSITWSIFFTTPQLGEKSSFNPDMARLLQKKTPLWNSIKTPLLIIQILPKYHPNNIQKSSRNHPDIIHISSRYHPHIIQISSKYHPVNIDFYSVKSRVFTQIWYNYCRWKLHFQTRLKLHFWKAKVEFYSSFCLLGSGGTGCSLPD